MWRAHTSEKRARSVGPRFVERDDLAAAEQPPHPYLIRGAFAPSLFASNSRACRFELGVREGAVLHFPFRHGCEPVADA